MFTSYLCELLKMTAKEIKFKFLVIHTLLCCNTCPFTMQKDMYYIAIYPLLPGTTSLFLITTILITFVLPIIYILRFNTLILLFKIYLIRMIVSLNI